MGDGYATRCHATRFRGRWNVKSLPAPPIGHVDPVIVGAHTISPIDDGNEDDGNYVVIPRNFQSAGKGFVACPGARTHAIIHCDTPFYNFAIPHFGFSWICFSSRVKLILAFCDRRERSSMIIDDVVQKLGEPSTRERNSFKARSVFALYYTFVTASFQLPTLFIIHIQVERSGLRAQR